MKIEAEIMTMIDGRITEVKLFDNLYTVNIKQLTTSFVNKNNGLDRGRRLGMRGHAAIYENILNKLRATPYDEHYAVFKKYYPEYVDVSVKTAVTQYRNEIKNPILTSAQSQFDFVKKHRKYHKRKPEGAVGFCKTYGMWIKQSSIDKVKQGVHKFAPNYKPTLKVLLSETGLPRSQLSATIRFLKDRGEIQVVRNKETNEVVYQPIVRIDEVK